MMKYAFALRGNEGVNSKPKQSDLSMLDKADSQN